MQMLTGGVDHIKKRKTKNKYIYIYKKKKKKKKKKNKRPYVAPFKEAGATINYARYCFANCSNTWHF